MYPSLSSHCEKNIRTPRARPSALAVVVLSAWFITRAALGATIPAPYELATWRDFRASAVSYTFDDNSPKQFSVAQPLFDERGLHATFFCIVGNLSPSQWSTIENASAKGHEIASHTLTHPDLVKLTSDQVTTEESDSKKFIESHTGKKCVSLAYPYCTVPDKSITSKYYAFARSCNGAFVPATPSDFLSIGALGPEIGMDVASDTVAGSGLWLVWLIHGIDDDPACCPTASAALKSNLDHVAGDPNKWWVETFGNVCRYIQERNAAVLTVVSEGSNSMTLRLTDNLDDTVFNYPLTLRRPMPGGWAAAAITQNGAPVPSRIVNGNLVFDVVPNGGDIVLAKAEPPPSSAAAHLVNVSIRATAGTGANTLIAGFVLSGNGAKPILLRGIGPTLSDYKVSDPLVDPSIVLYDSGGTSLGKNDNWGGAATLSTTFASLGAFSLAASSKDAALLTPLTAGPHTMHVTTSNSTSGTALAEVYDADTSSTDLHLVNISGRCAVDATSNLIAGFVVGGTGSMNVLVRAVGPTLTDYGVTGVLSNPKVTIYNSSGVALASNDDWGGTTTLSATFTKVGAFNLPAASKDAAILLSLTPGPYTAVVSGINGATGVALVEVYATPSSDGLSGGAPIVAPLAWTTTAPLVYPTADERHPIVAVKDPSVVFHDGLWHIFATTASSNGWGMAYFNFASWDDAPKAKPFYLDDNPNLAGYNCAPQVFYFRPQNKWYLIFQSQQPRFSTTNNIADPKSWSAPQDFFQGTPKSVVEGWLDYWIICDDTHAYLFFPDDHGRFYRSRTRLENFPRGFEEPVVVMQEASPADLFEGSCVYRIKGTNQYLCLVECADKNWNRYYRAFTADRLDGEWKPLPGADSAASPFAGNPNVSAEPGATPWANGISHGELVREGSDETMTVDPKNLQFLYQGVRLGASAPDYLLLPYRLALLRLTSAALTIASAR